MEDSAVPASAVMADERVSNSGSLFPTSVVARIPLFEDFVVMWGPHFSDSYRHFQNREGPLTQRNIAIILQWDFQGRPLIFGSPIGGTSVEWSKMTPCARVWRRELLRDYNQKQFLLPRSKG